MTTDVSTSAPVDAAPVDAAAAVEQAARAARATVPGLASVPDGHLDHALRAMADHLGLHADDVLEANAADMRAARADGLHDALLDRLRLDDVRLSAMAGQLRALAAVPSSRPGARSGSCPAGCCSRSAAGRSA